MTEHTTENQDRLLGWCCTTIRGTLSSSAIEGRHYFRVLRILFDASGKTVALCHHGPFESGTSPVARGGARNICRLATLTLPSRCAAVPRSRRAVHKIRHVRGGNVI